MGDEPNITSFSGVPLIMETYRSLGLNSIVDECLKLKEKGWSENTILEEIIFLKLTGGDCMDDVEQLKVDGLKRLGWQYDESNDLASASAVRRFLHMFDNPECHKYTLGEASIPEEGSALKGLNELHRHLLRKMIRCEKPSYITLDADATVVFSEKAECLPTYKGGTGYQPIQAIWAEKGIVVADEFRDGNVPAAFNALPFLKKCETNLPKDIHLRIRSDGAWYDHALMTYCVDKKYEFSITADLSQGLMRFVYEIPEAEWKDLYRITDKGKEKTEKQYAELSFTSAGLSQTEIKRRMREYRYIVTRTLTKEPDLFSGKYEYTGIVTNMDWQIERLINFHYERAGSIEHVIDSLKNGLGGNKFPCGTFGANAAWWRITCITHNLTQCLKIIALPFEWFHIKMKRLRFRLLCVAGKIIKHSRQMFLQLARGHPVFPIYNEARIKLALTA